MLRCLMTDRDALVLTLAAIARRLRLNAVLGELAWIACAIAGAVALYQILAAVILAPAALSALTTLLVLLLLGTIALFAARGMRAIPLEQAAAAADALANLRDELKTGHWLLIHAQPSPLIDLQIRRAALTARRINLGEVFPVTMPRCTPVALGLVLAAGVLSWSVSHLDHSRSPLEEFIPAVVLGARTQQLTSGSRPTSDPLEAKLADPEQIPSARATDAAWAKLETALRALGQGEELKDMAAAITQRDAGRAVRLLEELEGRRQFARAQSGERAIAGAAHASPDLVARLQELFSTGGNVPQSALDARAADELAQALDLAKKLDDMRASGANNAASHDLDEGTNPLQAALPLERFGPREARRSEGQGGEFEGSTDVEGGAMGRRVTQSTAGTVGEPSGNDESHANNIDADQVSGKKTMRLATQLKKLKIEGGSPDAGDAQGIADATFAATRAQQAQFVYQNASNHARYVTEGVIGEERIPLAYRGAVKEYFLDLNRSEK